MRFFPAFLGIEPLSHSEKYSIFGSSIIASKPKNEIWYLLLKEVESRLDVLLDENIDFGSIFITKVFMENPNIASNINILPHDAFYPIDSFAALQEIRECNTVTSYCIHYWKDFVKPSHIIPMLEEPNVYVLLIFEKWNYKLLESITNLEFTRLKLHLCIVLQDSSIPPQLSRWYEKWYNSFASCEMIITSKSFQETLLQKLYHIPTSCRFVFIVQDCVYLLPHTLYDLISSSKPITSPLLYGISKDVVSNFGIGRRSNPIVEKVEECKILMQEKGIFPVRFVSHCILIHVDFLDRLQLEKQSDVYTVSGSACKKKVGQYVCNIRFYGFFQSFVGKDGLDEKLANAMKDQDSKKVKDVIRMMLSL